MNILRCDCQFGAVFSVTPFVYIFAGSNICYSFSVKLAGFALNRFRMGGGGGFVYSLPSFAGSNIRYSFSVKLGGGGKYINVYPLHEKAKIYIIHIH